MTTADRLTEHQPIDRAVAVQVALIRLDDGGETFAAAASLLPHRLRARKPARRSLLGSHLERLDRCLRR